MSEVMETSHQPSLEAEFAGFERQNGNQIKINFLFYQRTKKLENAYSCAFEQNRKCYML